MPTLTINFPDSVRRRPGMYVGNVDDSSGLHHLLWEVLSNCCDQLEMGNCNSILLILHVDQSISVIDNGPGFIDERIEGVPILTKSLQSMHDTPSLTGHVPHDHVGNWGLGLAPVSALCRYMEIRTCRDGYERYIRSERGHIVCAEQSKATDLANGTMVKFLPDDEIFSNVVWDRGIIEGRIRQLAAFFPESHWRINDERQWHLHSPSALLSLLPTNNSRAYHFWHFDLLHQEEKHIQVRLSGVLCIPKATHDQPTKKSFVNWQESKGGTHVEAFIAGLRLALQALDADPKQINSMLEKSSFVCRIQLRNPSYKSPTKDYLANTDLRQPLIKLVSADFSQWLKQAEQSDVRSLFQAR